MRFRLRRRTARPASRYSRCHLAIHCPTFTPQHHVHPSIPIPTFRGCDVAYTLSQPSALRPSRSIAVERSGDLHPINWKAKYAGMTVSDARRLKERVDELGSVFLRKRVQRTKLRESVA